MKRCSWCNPNNPLYIEYHDSEWGVPNFDEQYLLEMLILESFQAGLSWECVLNKREAFRAAYDNFDIARIVNYDEKKIAELLANPKLIRNQRKIRASIKNARVFGWVQQEYSSFYNYLTTFIDHPALSKKNKPASPLIHETGLTTNPWSDAISEDLVRRGMTFVGPKIIYAYLQAIGFIDSHEDECFTTIRRRHLPNRPQKNLLPKNLPQTSY